MPSSLQTEDFGTSSAPTGGSLNTGDQSAVSADVPFTPGPWKATPSGEGYIVSRHDVFVVGHAICGVRPSQAATEDQCEANARLIAAAPDMLAALQEIADGWHGGETSAVMLRDIARAAIARATGKAE